MEAELWEAAGNPERGQLPLTGASAHGPRKSSLATGAGWFLFSHIHFYFLTFCLVHGYHHTIPTSSGAKHTGELAITNTHVQTCTPFVSLSILQPMGE